MSNIVEYKDLIAFHPGCYIKDMIDELEISQEEFAIRLQTTPKNISKLINGQANLSNDMALKLSNVFGTSVSFWLNLQKTFEEKKIEINKEIQKDKELEYLESIEYKFWENLGLVKKVTKKTERIDELLKYLKISSFEVLKGNNFLVQYRTSISEVKEINVINANAWVQTAINIGCSRDVKKFDKNKLKQSLPRIKTLSTLDQKYFCDKLYEILNECGVTLVMLPNLKNCGINGAVKWINDDKVILAINNRRKHSDIFWFSLFHELGHVLQQRKKVIFLSDDSDNEMYKTINELENEANEFARNTLIPCDEYKQFVDQTNKFTEYNIQRFANKLNIHPSIVLGRLQADQYIPFSSYLNKMKVKYEF